MISSSTHIGRPSRVLRQSSSNLSQPPSMLSHIFSSCTFISYVPSLGKLPLQTSPPIATLRMIRKSSNLLVPPGLEDFMTGRPSIYQTHRPPSPCSGCSHAKPYVCGFPILDTGICLTRCLPSSDGSYDPQCKHVWLSFSPFHDSMMSTSPSPGHLNGSHGSSQKAGQIPFALGALILASTYPNLRPSNCFNVNRADVYLFVDFLESTIALMTKQPFLVWNEFSSLLV